MNDEIEATSRRAMGFLELGMPGDALAELDELPVHYHSSSLVLHLRVDAMFRIKDWAKAAELCMPMLDKEAEDPSWWIQAAYAQRRAVSVEAAEPILRAALEHHPRHGLILYNLACYACVQGREDEARALLDLSDAAEPGTYLAMAAGDPDLKAISRWVVEKLASRH